MLTTLFLTFGVFLLAAIIGGMTARRFAKAPLWLTVLCVVSTLPAMCYAGYYLHLVDEPVLLYRLRAVSGSELMAGMIGLPMGWLAVRLGRSPVRAVRLSSLGLAIAPMLVVIPYAKSLTTPLDAEFLHERWDDGICLQSTGSTCGPSSAATLLHAVGLPGNEAALAQEAHTSASGTEIWYLARALRARGMDVSFRSTTPNPEMLPYPAIAGTSIGGRGGTGHFIAILGRTGEQYVIGDPTAGRILLSTSEIGTTRYFTGFFLVVKPPG